MDTGDKEVKSEIPETDRPTNVVKIFEVDPQSSSVLGINWNVDTDRLIVCLGTEQQINWANVNQGIVISFVSAVFDTLEICSLFTITRIFLLKSFWAAMRQAWDKESNNYQQVFVANRAAAILEKLSMDQWRHVKAIEITDDIGNSKMSIEGLRESVLVVNRGRRGCN